MKGRVFLSHSNAKLQLPAARDLLLAVERAALYHRNLIRSFADKETQRLFETGRSRKFSTLSRTAIRKLAQLDLVEKLEDLRAPPGNHLEALAADRKGQYSVRINDQFRICFRWDADGAHDVGVVDYH